jgi:uncharacterized protein YkwD
MEPLNNLRRQKMNKRLFIVISLAALILSNCGAQTPTETAAPTETQVIVPTVTAMEAQATEIPATTEVTDALSTETSTPEPRPTNAPNCTNKASFVTDVTIPDNTSVNASAAFTKTWRISNAGTCIWAADYTLSYYSDERMGAPDIVPLAITYPGQTLDLSIELVAPSSPGTHRGNFVIKNPEGLIISIDDDSRLWLIIDVVGTAVVPTATSASAVATAIPTNTSTGSGSGTAACAFTTGPAKVTEAINAINTYRTQNGLPAYNIKEPLTKAAQSHASDMACKNLTGHTGSDGSTPGTRISKNGYVAAFSAENVYFSNPPLTGQGAVDWWKNDTGDIRHNLNLVSDTFIDAGVGYAFFNNNGYYVVVFATP